MASTNPLPSSSSSSCPRPPRLPFLRQLQWIVLGLYQYDEMSSWTPDQIDRHTARIERWRRTLTSQTNTNTTLKNTSHHSKEEEEEEEEEEEQQREEDEDAEEAKDCVASGLHPVITFSKDNGVADVMYVTRMHIIGYLSYFIPFIIMWRRWKTNAVRPFTSAVTNSFQLPSLSSPSPSVASFPPASPSTSLVPSHTVSSSISPSPSPSISLSLSLYCCFHSECRIGYFISLLSGAFRYVTYSAYFDSRGLERKSQVARVYASYRVVVWGLVSVLVVQLARNWKGKGAEPRRIGGPGAAVAVAAAELSKRTYEALLTSTSSASA